MPSHFKCYWTAFVLGVGIFIMSNEIEIWKDIPNYEGLYQASNFGRIKSLIKHNGTDERILKQCLCSKGYLYVGLSKNNSSRTIKVHVLIAMAFKGHRPDGTHRVVVDHKDNNKLNNRADNLNLISNRENASKDRKGGKSKYVGVHFNEKMGKWYAMITFNDRYVYLGSFELEIDTNNAYQKAKKEADEGLDLNILYPKGRHKTSKYKYVCFDKRSGMWLAKYKNKSLGYHKTQEDANQIVINYLEKLKKHEQALEDAGLEG